MKNVLFVLSLLVSGFVSSQSHNDTLQKWYLVNKLAVEKEFARLIDSARSSLMIEKDVIYRSGDGFSQKELKSIFKKETSDGNRCQVVKHSTGNKINFIIITKSFPVVKMKYDSLLSLAAEHHAKYLNDVVIHSGVIGHQEFKNYYGYEYNGPLPILENSKDRVKYYCPSRYDMGECAIDGIIGHIATLKRDAPVNYWVKNIDHVTVKSVAYHFFETFKGSPKHWDALMRASDIDLIGASFIMNFENTRMEFVTVMGQDKEKINNSLFVEGLSLK